jgi:ABC-2 type transport system permease protein
MPESFDSQRSAPATLSATRPFYWSVRRELWEYRSVYLAPLAAAGVSLLGFFFVLFSLPHTMRNAMATQQRDALARPFDLAAALIMGAAFIVSIFYALDTLYGERRDRSILFWKSMPVSDLTTVLAKATVPLVILPVIAFVVTLVTESIMLLFSSSVLAASGLSVATLVDQLQPFQTMLMLLYHLVTVHMLWYAPLYAWMLLISAWARRAPFLWAALPALAVGIFEKMVFHTSYFVTLLEDRISGSRTAMDDMQDGFHLGPGMRLTPGSFLLAPGLWLGLILAAIFLVAAARLRRYREAA